MKVIRNIFSHLPTFILWLLASFVFWGWIFTFVTDTSPEKKITIYCDVPKIRDRALATVLEENMPEGLRMVKVHPFSYVMFDEESIAKGDIFLLPASDIASCAEFLAPGEIWHQVMAFDSVTGLGAADSYIEYLDQDYYLFLGSGSVHLEDGKAAAVAEQLLAID